MREIDSGTQMPKLYDPKSVESKIYAFWESGGYFTAKIDKAKKPFVLIMPPPNVTGALHMGHALTTAIEDLLVRWNRMKGTPTLFLPGTDHAGIATQVVVERQLATNGESRHSLGREAFEAKIWEWVGEYGDQIYRQLRRLGASCDWSRQKFTLDPGPRTAVRRTFVDLYKKGLIYRGERITNWCPRCATVLSDLEVKYQDEEGAIYFIKYPYLDAEGAITVATTRPETLLGDTGVAVNPTDERYRDQIGGSVVLPIMGRTIPIISDEAVDPDFGTGALKVTPGHDVADFEIGQRNGLETLHVMNLDCTMNANAGPYQGLDRYQCREQIIVHLKKDGFLEEIRPYTHAVGHCDRCGEVIEPIVSNQWYVEMKTLAAPAREAVANGQIKIIPERFNGVYFNWMDNIRDWTISRQLWWGHQIPVWYCDLCDQTIVEYDDPSICPQCASDKLSRDQDVLDTWFSSGLWTHSTLGWPSETDDLAYFYPSSVLETGYDILFFWVARMIILGVQNLGAIPFPTVYLHGLVLDPEGVKMSKTKGNVLDPIQLIDIYGADAVRFSLTTNTSAGNNMRLNEQRLEASRNFANKLWNAARFVMSNLRSGTLNHIWNGHCRAENIQDRWILSKLSRVSAQVNERMGEYQFGEAQRLAHDFLWNDYCDWYIEFAKIRLKSTDDSEESPMPALSYVLERTLRMLHPFLPFVTEGIWQILRDQFANKAGAPVALIVAPYPEFLQEMIDEEAELSINSVIEVVRAIRNLRAELHIELKQPLEAVIDAPELGDAVMAQVDVIKRLCGLSSLRNAEVPLNRTSSTDISMVITRGTLTVSLEGVIDIGRERMRLEKEADEIKSYGETLRGRLNDSAFLSRAPEEVIDRERKRLMDVQDRIARLDDVLARIADFSLLDRALE